MADYYELDMSVLEGLIESTPAKIDQFGRAVTESITNDIKLSFNTSPPGMEYTRGDVTHIASQPGYPPNIDTGALVNSMHWEQIAALTWHIMDGVEYGLPLEEGTEAIQPRPFVQPVFAAWRKGRLEQLALAYGIVRP